MRLEQESRRGEMARRLLEDPLLQEAFATLDTSLRDAWAATADDATAERERLWQMLKLLSRVRASLTEVVETGKLADMQIVERKPASTATTIRHANERP